MPKMKDTTHKAGTDAQNIIYPCTNSACNHNRDDYIVKARGTHYMQAK